VVEKEESRGRARWRTDANIANGKKCDAPFPVTEPEIADWQIHKNWLRGRTRQTL